MRVWHQRLPQRPCRQYLLSSNGGSQPVETRLDPPRSSGSEEACHRYFDGKGLRNPVDPLRLAPRSREGKCRPVGCSSVMESTPN